MVADFRDRNGALIAGLEVGARFVHPFDRSADRETLLASDGEAYEGVASPLHAGRWTLVIEARQDGQVKFTSHNKITLPKRRRAAKGVNRLSHDAIRSNDLGRHCEQSEAIQA